MLPTFTINDKSFESFEQWVQFWSEKLGLQLSIPQENLVSRPIQTKSFEVVSKTKVGENPDNTFLITLKSKQKLQFTSGDLLAVYPKDDYRERLYSIGKVNGNTQLSVKYYANGLGSNYLNDCEIGDSCKARLIQKVNFHIPKNASKVIMIANGTGIAPFLGLLDQNKKTECEAYFGLRAEQSCGLYKSQLEDYLETKKLTSLHLAYSQQHERFYIQHLLERDGSHNAKTLEDKGIIMICGSVAKWLCIKMSWKPCIIFVFNSIKNH